jgi:alkanesulfonate monooxygenase SsuD/methylene tetrahydromethanopterin reductase-like flavin-dependent oxidoreductase (luciferase family)
VPGQPPTFGLLAPLNPQRGRFAGSGARTRPDGLAGLIRGGVVDALWLRDLPVTPCDDDDAGQGTDPFVHLAHLAGAGVLPPLVGTASVILGTRHPYVLARAALTLQTQTGGRFVLGLGTGGKPAMNAALGVDHRTLADFADEWWTVRRALLGQVARGVELTMPAPCDPPPLYLATTDTERWRAVDGDPDGWLAFAGPKDAFCAQLDELCGISGRRLEVGVRLDATVVSAPEAPLHAVPERGRVVGTIGQLVELIRRWRLLPVTHLLINVRSADPVDDLVRLAQA